MAEFASKFLSPAEPEARPCWLWSHSSSVAQAWSPGSGGPLPWPGAPSSTSKPAAGRPLCFAALFLPSPRLPPTLTPLPPCYRSPGSTLSPARPSGRTGQGGNEREMGLSVRGRVSCTQLVLRPLDPCVPACECQGRPSVRELVQFTQWRRPRCPSGQGGASRPGAGARPPSRPQDSSWSLISFQVHLQRIC